MCFVVLQREEADAVAVDGGQVYTAGKCGLVPAMVEQYNEGMTVKKDRKHQIKSIVFYLSNICIVSLSLQTVANPTQVMNLPFIGFEWTIGHV